ncbi:glycosyltransferase [Heliobacterium gestii]|uniref:Glycosyltransferase n=1 Tax=Heliomicrobium gestii TaxID=2699 RepID=A0A845L8N9_HELGE|nr:glycosyltransferase family 1 protein [Heliomicrobium gestii]MBM7866613.1 glycosyltransferase involved in cell wall biosynthesis [Heliomicrobium gestii]MZP43107.1 glycosyltransferase [Heliomicrobium gestii]
MKIGYDVSQTAENKAGCGFFADQLIHALARVDRKNEYLLYPTFFGYRHPDFLKATFPEENGNVKMLLRDLSFNEVNHWWSKRGNRMDRLGNPDIIHSNNYSCPKDVNARIVMTVYDLVYVEVPDLTTEENRLVCFQGIFDASIYADYLIMISEATRKAFIRHFPHYPEDRIKVIPLGSRPSIRKITVEKANNIIERLYTSVAREGNRDKVKLDQFWLGVGTVEPRKNYRLLIQAYNELVKSGKGTMPLFIAGGKGWKESDIGDFVKSCGLEEKVHFLGYVTDEELSALYSRCYAFIYPSFYEGFGLPILEAMNCGAPVITSQTTSMPEVVGEAGLLIDPYSIKSLIDAMWLLESDSSMRDVLIQRGAEQIKKFTWDEAAKSTLEVYEKVVTMEPWYNHDRKSM